MNYYIIDTLGPFIDSKHPINNWSKIPFEYYEIDNNLDKEFNLIVSRFKKFIKKIKSIGYNSITLDDLSHIVILDFYSDEIKKKLLKFSKLYSKIIDIANYYNIKVFINFDIMYFNNDILKYTRLNDNNIIKILSDSINYLFTNYNVEGIVSRIGECDGIDVKGIFKSKIIIKNSKQAKKFIKKMLSQVEKNNKIWIFRTWTTGKNKIGDMMWNEKTYFKMFKDIDSKNFIISMKYGYSDFFRNMKLNDLFLLKGHKKIIELQAKREYDFFGELPYYTGFEYKKYYDLIDKKDLEGIMVWCQTGGWIKSNKITFLNNSSKYVELNTISTLNIFKGKNPKFEIQNFFNNKNMIEFFEKYNDLSDKILYPKNKKELFFNKVYIPPTIWIFWNNIVINSFTTTFVNKYYEKINIKEEEFNYLLTLGIKCKLKNIVFYIETMKLLYSVRLAFQKEISINSINEIINKYNQKYNFFFSLVKTNNKSFLIKLILKIFIRERKNYRIIDRLITNKIFIYALYYAIILGKKKSIPAFVNNQAMPLKDIIS
jgi:hypothetical protein